MPETDHSSNLLISFIFLLVIASFTAYYANNKGRNPFIWFALGALLGIFAPLILLFLPNLNEEQGMGSGEPTMSVSRPDASLEHDDVPPPTPTLEELRLRKEEDKLWYYLDQNHQQMGPVSIVALRELWNTGRLELISYVWSEGMDDWKKVEVLPELIELLKRP